jgi:2-hydroxycyclohexanecarboxyl-CoA dehydrogenase
MSLPNLEGKKAVVTGGARGIGRGIVEALARAGADVVIGDFLVDEASRTAEAVHHETGREVTAVRVDVTRLEDTVALRDAALKAMGRIDILVNNAGWDHLTPFLKSAPEDWQRIIGVNYLGVIHTCYAVLPHMSERKQGAVVNISSDSARVGSLGEAVYSGAKAAVVAFSKTIAREHARDGIRVNAVCPGLVDTPLLAEIQSQDFGRKVIGAVTAFIPFKRLGRPEDVAPLVVFLASDAAAYITGQVTSVSGGLTMAG